MEIEEIIENHLNTNSFNNNFIELKAEEVQSYEGKATRFDLHFEVKTKSGETVIVILEIQRQQSRDEIIRAVVYPAKLVSAQYHKNYQDFFKVISSWINLDPPAELRNTILISEMWDSVLEFSGNNYTKTLKTDKPSKFNLITIIQFNIGGPEYPNFGGIIKLLFDLFNNNQEEVQKHYQSKGIEFNIEEIFNSMMKFKTLDEQTRDIYRKEGLEKGREEGKYEYSIEIAKRMLKDNLSTDLILSYLPNLTLENLNSLQKEITQDF